MQQQVIEFIGAEEEEDNKMCLGNQAFVWK
jgi:hypothetical protein